MRDQVFERGKRRWRHSSEEGRKQRLEPRSIGKYIDRLAGGFLHPHSAATDTALRSPPKILTLFISGVTSSDTRVMLAVHPILTGDL